MILVWVDLEMTGLDPEKDVILELAIILTDMNLNELPNNPRFHAIINQPQSVLDNMNEWCIEHHGKSGLTKSVLESTLKLEHVEGMVIEFLGKHVEVNQGMIAGNSVYMDKMFIHRYMPRMFQYLHYRIVDVSTVKELCKAWNQRVFESVPKKALAHRAFDDILESIEELRFYKEKLFITE